MLSCAQTLVLYLHVTQYNFSRLGDECNLLTSIRRAASQAWCLFGIGGDIKDAYTGC